MENFEERIAALRDGLSVEAALFEREVSNPDFEPPDETPYDQVAFDLIQSVRNLDEARVLHLRLNALQAELAVKHAKHFAILPVVQCVTAAEAVVRQRSDNPYYRQANFIFFDAQVEHALTLDDEEAQRFQLGQLSRGKCDGDVSSGTVYALVAIGPSTIKRKSRVVSFPFLNPEAKIKVTYLDKTVIKVVDRYSPQVAGAFVSA